MSAQALYVVRYTLSKNGGVVHTLTGGARGPAAAVGTDTHAATEKATPVDADELPLSDSAASWVLKKLTWANLKATLKAYFDTLYQPVAAALTSWAGVTRASGFDTFAATPSSANLRSLVTDETGTGALVFGTSPSFTSSLNVDAKAGIGTTSGSGYVNLVRPSDGYGFLVYPDASNVLQFKAGSGAFGAYTTLMTLSDSGLLSLNYGQIKFPATQSASSDPNTLDDYEEGTFTPALSFGGGSTGLTYSVQNGSYTKVGRAVHFRIYLQLSAKGSSTGIAGVGGLPFTSGGSNNYASVAFQVTGLTGLTGMIQGYIPQSDTQIALSDSRTGTRLALSETNFSDTAELMISGTYFV